MATRRRRRSPTGRSQSPSGPRRPVRQDVKANRVLAKRLLITLQPQLAEPSRNVHGILPATPPIKQCNSLGHPIAQNSSHSAIRIWDRRKPLDWDQVGLCPTTFQRRKPLGTSSIDFLRPELTAKINGHRRRRRLALRMELWSMLGDGIGRRLGPRRMWRVRRRGSEHPR